MKQERTLILIVITLASLLPFVSPLLRGEVFAFRDHFDYFVPLRSFTASSLRAGEIPLWNPFNGSGERWLANPQTGLFYPPAWIFLVLPFPSAYVLYLWIHILILGVGGYFLFRRWSSPWAALIAAVALMLCGPTLSLLDVSNNLGTFAWFPLVLHLGITRGNGVARRPLALDGLVITLMFLGGEPFLAAIGAVLYAVVFGGAAGALARRSGRPRAAAPPLAQLAMVALFAVLLSAAQLVPFLELLTGSDRAEPAEGKLLRESMAPRDWLAAVLPTADPIRQDPLSLSQQYIPSVYLGLAIVFAASVATVAGRKLDRLRQRAVAGWLVLFAISVVLAGGSAILGGSALWHMLRLDISRFPARIIPIGALALMALAAIGLDVFAEKSRRWKSAAWIVLLVVSIAAIVRFAPTLWSWRLMVVAVWLMVIALLTLRRLAVVLPLLFIPLLATDYLISAGEMLYTRKLHVDLEPYRSILQGSWKIARLMTPGATLGSEVDRRAWLSGYLNLLIRRFDAGTPAPVISERYLELHDRALTEPRTDIVDFLSIRYLATNREIQHPAYRLIAREGGVRLFENSGARSAAQIWSSPSNSDAVPVQFRGLNEVIVDVDASAPSVVTLSQLDAPGWRVEIDGRAAISRHAHEIFRAVEVTAGRHRVRWVYRPRSVMIGCILSTIALVLGVGETFHVCRRRGRGRLP